jgi:uncharacterized protein YxjI
MTLYMKQQIFSWSDKFTIKDELGNDRYFVEGELFSWGHKLHVFDANNREVAFIKQELFVFLPKFDVYVNGSLAVSVKRELTVFTPKYTLEGTDWTVDGDFWQHRYEITGSSGGVASITKALFTWGDSYEIEISADADELLVLATVLAIDCVIADQSRSS